MALGIFAPNEAASIAIIGGADEMCIRDRGVIEQLGGKPVKFYKADIADRRTIQSIFKHSAVDAVIHFAGLKAVGESVQKPLRCV